MTAPSARSAVLSGVLALALLVGGFGAWAALSSLTGAVVAPGRVEVARNRQEVQHPDGGRVTALAVAEGDAVRAGQVLLRLDADAARTEHAIVEAHLWDALAERARLEAERDDAESPVFDPVLAAAAARDLQVAALLDGQRRLFATRRDGHAREAAQLRLQRRQIAAEVAGIEALRRAVVTQAALIARERAAQQALLDRGLAQAARVLALEREAARLAGSDGELAADRARAETRQGAIDLALLRLDTARREAAETALRGVQPRVLELAERRRALRDRIGRAEVRAPVAGVVHALQVHGPGAVIRPAETLMLLVPRDRPLIVTARVPPAAIDHVHPGQPVTLHRTAAGRGAGGLSGVVTKVSADAFSDEAGRSFFRVEIVPTLNAPSPDAAAALRPGMPVEAFIATGTRSPLSYLAAPLADALRRSLRES
ncbi:HlyD family type I secretion periplasmic adaptor subunit [Pseudooceanicola sp. LIPI14-2-Ac024]|uniref:HlyD family type I secretion periplasmic adaptor subunit n=1 Tax=Pseudooceanicola sp. LIPI14-2-Ac024 TaxID=3344875 RepID=UPI0035D06681